MLLIDINTKTRILHILMLVELEFSLPKMVSFIFPVRRTGL